MNACIFEEMTKVGKAFNEKKQAHNDKKQDIINTYGWDSEELKAWYQEKETMKFPYSEGACKAYRAYRKMMELHETEIEMDDHLWDGEVHDFIETLRTAEATTFVFTCTSTGLMGNLHDFAKEGCKMLGLCEIKRTMDRWGETTDETIQGIRFQL